MDPDLLKAGLGAVIGFGLAQAASLAKLLWRVLTSPQLTIKERGAAAAFLIHEAEISQGESAREEVYGFTVRNTGRAVATDVRFQLLRLDVRHRNAKGPNTLIADTLDLSRYGGGSDDKPSALTLVPHAEVQVEVGRWREDWDCLRPSAPGAGEYYEESASGASEYMLKVATFDGKGHYATADLRISRSSRR